MPAVIFAAPILSENASSMLAAIARLEHVRLGVITQSPADQVPAALRGQVAHWAVNDVLDVEQLMAAARGLAPRIGEPERLFGAYEQLQVPLADARERLGIPGMSAEAARNFRDKARMKDVLRAAGIPCARHALAASEPEALERAHAMGFPLVVKPPAGAGAQATHRVEHADALRAVLSSSRPSPDRPVLLEEFVTGNEHSFETVSIGGRAVWHSLTHYYPTPLEVLRNPWIQWCVVLPREVEEPQYDDIRDAAARALTALGMDTGLSHMEWFRRHDGTIAISEVGARPPGAQITTIVSRAHDFDFIGAWARLMVYGTFSAPPRKYAVGAAYLRGQGTGRVRAVHGLAVIEREMGGLVADFRLPKEGQEPTGTYEGEGFIILRHPETQVVAKALHRLISVVKVELG